MEVQQNVLVLAGLFCFAGGLFGWAWFLDNRQARFLVRILGPNGVRIFYVVLGLALVVIGFIAEPRGG